ncbi:hypothetical protein EON81_02050 [bacterium]|nr:MAG: hypothetical protein EON81_02050 [bacterium]
MKATLSIVALLGAVVFLAGCSGGETLDPKDSVAGSLKGLKNEPVTPKNSVPKVDKDKKKAEPAPGKGTE